ncbi:single-stranded-DNA-specific exonuclease RecJ [[Phormidium ambiguum] IAM M-71]|uniref:Single-stranded-DNA-specific exonuclease RecJ n=1 Tax=[Phormidium ambiguum] IAM M-71 TaxID=454136 RepID=A0A1U7IRG8_9CYAN|nr:single-stranded-DNA-specific exonuclease RecJ [Phormidium ambiguum]OKH39983.1 single-stranded-DNA-specific exonuclease RecJ [Phormidium ambiguum IAM M-71]
MPQQQPQWQIQLTVQPPEWLINAVKQYAPDLEGKYAAQLLWQRGICNPEQLAEYLSPDLYKPASPFAFGEEMNWAMERLLKARDRQEIVAIWGDFDADGITSTTVLWEGLGQFFGQNQQLFYYVPNRFTESHGLNCQGIEKLAEKGVKLIVTCDTGSTNLIEIEFAQKLGIDVIITDHHTLLPERPPVVAIINPRNLPPDHQLFNLSGVAVAYKVVEALYQTLPNVPQQPLEDLLDLVAIGLIADLVQLSGDCRYLAKLGIEKLQTDLQKAPKLRRHPGIGRLLELCKKSGDRPTDISFGIGPRINAVSRIQGDATFCVELLTSKDLKLIEKLAAETELANSRRKALQKDVEKQVWQKLAQLDLSTTSIIVLTEVGWPVGVLGLVAGQVAQETGRPTILLSIETAEENSENVNFARGSARSVNQIDLYQLVKDQAHLLHRFGGHPFAAGLSIPVENIPVFTEAIDRQLRQQIAADPNKLNRVITADLVVKVAELGQDLFREMKVLEPCGMGNPVPQLMIKNCWFDNLENYNIKDAIGNKVTYIKTNFLIKDTSTKVGFPGIWWGHYKDEVPQGRCDAIVELDFNTYQKRYEVRLIAVRSCAENFELLNHVDRYELDRILDWRNAEIYSSNSDKQPLIVRKCPSNWDDLQLWFRQALQSNRNLAIAYPSPPEISPNQIWEDLVGIAKYLSRTGKTATPDQLQQKLGISVTCLYFGLETLAKLGFQVTNWNGQFQITNNQNLPSLNLDNQASEAIAQFLAAVQEEQFRRHYFYEVPLATIQSVVARSNYGETE